MALCFTERPQDLGYRRETAGMIRIDGKDINYRTLCSDTILYAPDGSEMGTIFSIACLGEGENRPVMVIFNGGPGSNCNWLQLGLMGPRLSQTGEDGMPPKSGPYTLRDNPDCLLDLCDLLFYNPPGAGYSRLFDEKYAPLVFGDHGDADAAEQFIRRWLKDNGRENAPLYIMGESFGSTRGSLLAQRLSDLDLRAVLHVGPGYTGDSWPSRSLKDLVPCAATRWYFDPSPDKGTLEDTVAKARKFLQEEYLAALYQGTMLPEAGQRRIAEKLAELTGLDAQYYMDNGLQVVREDFRVKLLEKQGLKVGSYDARFTLPLDQQGDPTLAAFSPFIKAGAEMYFSEIMEELPKRAFRGSSFDRSDEYLWAFNAEEDMEGYGGCWYPMQKTVSQSVHEAWLKRPNLRLFFATGYFDTVATVENTRYGISHTRIPFENVTLREYASGHAVYADDVSRHQLAQDVRAFMQEE